MAATVSARIASTDRVGGNGVCATATTAAGRPVAPPAVGAWPAMDAVVTLGVAVDVGVDGGAVAAAPVPTGTKSQANRQVVVEADHRIAEPFDSCVMVQICACDMRVSDRAVCRQF